MTVEEVKELESCAARKGAMTRYDQSSRDKGGLRLSALDTCCLIQKAAFGRRESKRRQNQSKSKLWPEVCFGA